MSAAKDPIPCRYCGEWLTNRDVNELVADALDARKVNWCRARLLHALAGAAEQGVLEEVIEELTCEDGGCDDGGTVAARLMQALKKTGVAQMIAKVVITLTPDWTARRTGDDSAEQLAIAEICDSLPHGVIVEVHSSSGDLLYTPKDPEVEPACPEDACESCHCIGWVHIDFDDGRPDGVYNCDCAFGQTISHELAMERHAETCGCDEYAEPLSDAERATK